MEQEHSAESHCHGCGPADKSRRDWLLLLSFGGVALLYFLFLLAAGPIANIGWLERLAQSVFEIVNTIWWGILLGILMVAILSRVPREFVLSILGSRSGLRAILRATAAGVLLDLCSHGILMVGAKLYERGASIGQVMAFLIASPWNSFTLTLVLFALVGIYWTLAFIACSMLSASSVGRMFDALAGRGAIPKNPRALDLPEDFHFWREAKQGLEGLRITPAYLGSMLSDGFRDSLMVLRWLLFGVLLASLIRTLLSPEHFADYFGPTLAGLGLTLLATTIIEVCSEGSTPIAADLLNRARAPGNGFTFLMAGVATDYTEVMVVKDTTKSWKIALLLPLLTVPQVLVIGWLMNNLA